MYGYEKSSKMQDKILDRISDTRAPKAKEPVHDLSKPAWTPERWQHRINPAPTPAPAVDLGTFAAAFGKK